MASSSNLVFHLDQMCFRRYPVGSLPDSESAGLYEQSPMSIRRLATRS
jgi:hypothetical protein